MCRNRLGENANPGPYLARPATEADKIPVAGNIAWITPKGAQNNQAAGIGVHFSDMDGAAVTVKNKIENYLAEKLNSDKPTHTM